MRTALDHLGQMVEDWAAEVNLAATADRLAGTAAAAAIAAMLRCAFAEGAYRLWLEKQSDG